MSVYISKDFIYRQRNNPDLKK